mmetsp:Transcript_25688/g.39414  ORF Transcript_25688/g.39414 Transcript_25688/m.39414 type:complete len:114 (-) Transcript_25688:250-591(-)
MTTSTNPSSLNNMSSANNASTPATPGSIPLSNSGSTTSSGSMSDNNNKNNDNNNNNENMTQDLEFFVQDLMEQMVNDWMELGSLRYAYYATRDPFVFHRISNSSKWVITSPAE